jgi:hypothetical protein
VALFLLFFTNDSNSLPDTYLDLNNQTAGQRFWEGKIVALFGSFSSAIYFMVSRQMKSVGTPPFLTLNISLFGIFIFFFLELFFEGYMKGDENDSIFFFANPEVTSA